MCDVCVSFLADLDTICDVFLLQGFRHKFKEFQGLFPLAVCGNDEAIRRTSSKCFEQGTLYGYQLTQTLHVSHEHAL